MKKNSSKLFVEMLVVLVRRRTKTLDTEMGSTRAKTKSKWAISWWAICSDDLLLIEPLFPTSLWITRALIAFRQRTWASVNFYDELKRVARNLSNYYVASKGLLTLCNVFHSTRVEVSSQFIVELNIRLASFIQHMKHNNILHMFENVIF